MHTAKDIVRDQVSITNLRAYARDHDVAAAEYIKACLTVNWFGAVLLICLNA